MHRCSPALWHCQSLQAPEAGRCGPVCHDVRRAEGSGSLRPGPPHRCQRGAARPHVCDDHDCCRVLDSVCAGWFRSTKGCACRLTS